MAFDQRSGGVRDDAGQTQQDEGKGLDGPEIERERGQLRRSKQQDHGGDKTANDRSNGGPAERLPGLTPLRHRVAVKARGSRLRGAGRVDQNGRDRAAIDRARIDRQKEQDRGRLPHRQREGQAHRDGHGRTAAGHRAHDNAQHCAEDERQQGLNREEQGERVWQ